MKEYQLSDLIYDPRNPENAPSCLSTGNEPAYKEVTLAQFNGNVNIDREEKDLITGEMVTVTKSYAFAEMAMSTSVSMKNLTVIDAYTTNNGGANQGAISLTCKDASGKTITVRTVPLYANGVLVTQDKYLGKTIDVKGIVDVYEGEYQIKVFHINNITIH